MSESKYKFPSRPKILAVSLAGILIALPAYAADNPPAEVTESSNIEALDRLPANAVPPKRRGRRVYKTSPTPMSAKNTSNATASNPPATCSKA